MKRTLLLCTLSLSLLTGYAQLSVNHLLTENLKNPIGLGETQPRFSWQIQSKIRNTRQTAYEIKVLEGKQVIWSSGKVQSDSSVHVAYKGSPLRSDTRYEWQVKVWDNHGKTSAWSAPAYFHIGLLDTLEWKAEWIQAAFNETPENRPAPLLRKEFTLNKKVKSATAYITSHGLYEAYLNGQRIGEYWLTPGWTSYNKRLQYQAYDVTGLLQNNKNAIGVMLGNGWYRSILGWRNNGDLYGNKLALLLQINITYTDGSKEIVATDGTWKSAISEILYSQIYNGEIIDARNKKEGWTKSGYNDAAWYGVNVLKESKSVLIATVNEPVKKQETFKPIKIFTTPAGEQVIDFGQNLVGWVKLKVKGKPGDRIVLSHAEVLDKKGNFYIENLRAAKAQAVYILKGEGEETFHPYFTWYGFRYVKVEGYPGELKPENFEAVALYSDMETTGTFTTSHPLINQLQHNIQWGQRGNFLDVPTDCPQRDERLGWTGDAQAFSRTAAFNMNVNNFFAKWLKDVEADQIDGRVPQVIPNVLGNNANSAGWGDAATIVPWNMYLAYGDKRILERQYNSMKAYVESIRRTAKDDLWNSGWHYGDWLFYRPFDDNDGKSAVTDKYLIAQCFYAHSTQLLINTARLLNKQEDVAEYSQLLDRIKKAFNREYVTPSGRLVSSTQTAYVLALQFDMLPQELRQQAAKRLVQNIESYNNHLTTGFLGTPYLCHVLTKFGYDSVAYKLLLQETCPSWLYPVKMGATTIWERWDGIKPDSTFQNPGMNSFNHYAYGAIGDWMYRKMAGIDTYEDGVGYKHIQIKPHVGDKFTYVSASLKTYYGTVSSTWKSENGKFILTIEIPVNTKATILIPAAEVAAITESGKSLNDVSDVEVVGKEDNYVVVKTGSGLYSFETNDITGK